MSVTDWSPQPSGNALADPSIKATRDGTAAREFSPSFRGLMAKAAALALDQGGALTSGGSGNVYVVATNSGFASLKPGVSLTFRADRSNTGAVVLHVDGSGPWAWLDADGSDFPAEGIKKDQLYTVAWTDRGVSAPPAWRTIGAVPVAFTKDITDLGSAVSDANAKAAQRDANLSDLADKAAARGNIGLGSAALLSASDPGKKALEQGDATDLAATISGAGAVARTLLSRFEENVQLSDFGWDKTGNTDAGPALRAAIAKLGTRGGTISMGAGVCWINSPVTWTQAIRLQGQGWREGAGLDVGSWIKITDPTITPFVLNSQSSRGAEFRDIAVWQQQPGLTGTTWAPTEYQPVWDIQNTLGAVKFSNIYLLSVTRGINNFNSGRLDIDGLYGQVFRYGVSIDNALDLPRIKRVHFWTYASSDSRILAWQLENADAIISARNDNPFFSDIFAIVMRSAFRFVASPAGVSPGGVTNKFKIVNLDADLCKHAIWVEGDGTSGQAVSVTHQGDSPFGGSYPGATAVKVAANNVSIQFNNFDARLQDLGAMTVTGTGHRLQVANGVVNNWDRSGTGKSAFDIADGGSAANANVLQASNIEFVGTGTNIFPNQTTGLVLKVSDYFARSSTPVFSPRIRATGGAGAVNLDANGRTVLSVDNPSGDSTILMRSGTGGMSLNVQSSTPSADIELKPQGVNGSARLWAAGGPAIRTAANSSSDTGLVVRRETGTVHLFTEGNANASIDLIPAGSGSVTLNGALRLNISNVTGSATASLGANSPATVPGAPYRWIAIKVSDGTTVYIPAWK